MFHPLASPRQMPKSRPAAPRSAALAGGRSGPAEQKARRRRLASSATRRPSTDTPRQRWLAHRAAAGPCSGRQTPFIPFTA